MRLVLGNIFLYAPNSARLNATKNIKRSEFLAESKILQNRAYILGIEIKKYEIRSVSESEVLIGKG